MLASSDKNIEKAVNKLKYISEDEHMRFALEQRERAEWEYKHDMHPEREAMAIEIAKKFKEARVSIEIIADSTGLSLEDLKKL